MNAKKIINRVAGLSLGLALVPMTAPAFAADSDYFQVPTSGPASLTEPLPPMPPAVSEAALVADSTVILNTEVAPASAPVAPAAKVAPVEAAPVAPAAEVAPAAAPVADAATVAPGAKVAPVEAAPVADAEAVAPTKASEKGVKAGVAPVNVQAKSAGFELSSPAIALGLVLGLALVAGSVLALRKVRH